MTLSTVTEPTAEPLTAAQVKTQLRVDGSDEDTLIDDLVKSARYAVEAYLRCRLITQTVRITLNGFPPHVEIPVWPVQSIDNVKYIDTDGVEQTLATTEYQLITSSKPNRIAPAYLKTWPTTRADYDVVTADVIVGFGAAGTDLPYDIRQALMLVVGDFFENRQNTHRQALHELPIGAKALLRPRRFWV